MIESLRELKYKLKPLKLEQPKGELALKQKSRVKKLAFEEVIRRRRL
jgi:hypothetical protein